MKERFGKFTGSVLELNRYVQKIKAAEMKKFGLRAGHTMCLYGLGRNPAGLTATQMSKLSREDKASVSRCIAELSERGLITCAAPPEGKRSYRAVYKLTEEGTRIVEGINRRIEHALLCGGKGLTDEQREELYSALGIILKNLEKYVRECEEER